MILSTVMKRLLLPVSFLAFLAIVFWVVPLIMAQSSNELIYACVAQAGSNSQSKNIQDQANTGSVRIVSSDTDCRNDEYHISWYSGHGVPEQINALQTQINDLQEEVGNL